MDIYQVTGLRKPEFVERIEKYCDLDEPTKELIQAAIVAQKNAYALYSHFYVGAAFRTIDGRIFAGCNIENASFTPTTCAERTALSKAVSEGYNEFVAGAVVAYQEDAFTTPCGVCRQFIMEFAPNDIPLFITKSQVNVEKANNDLVLATSIYNLLPHGFRTFKKN
ncbi:PREDICTED: cytidine deaminase-like [Rhagoletis zephyria]|uniref:cytidine deaminase-like n=1 Tax=Rhagoletis zephyria TaxID=28612 RepID=UPI000811527C|nr:PREDICTED: cytidine deaminase-like [Rhagoletis zephyria]